MNFTNRFKFIVGWLLTASSDWLGGTLEIRKFNIVKRDSALGIQPRMILDNSGIPASCFECILQSPIALLRYCPHSFTCMDIDNLMYICKGCYVVFLSRFAFYFSDFLLPITLKSFEDDPATLSL